MLGREDGVVEGLEHHSSDDSESPGPSKKAEIEGETLPVTEVR
jgi:hypothetical protein